MYGFNGYNPYMPYQQRLAQLEQPAYNQPVQALQQPQSVQMLKGRIVASVEEAKASQVDFDGSTTYFACPAEQKIYAKSIGLNGLPTFLTYKLCANDEPKKEEITIGKDFDDRLSTLEKKVKELYDELTTTVTAGQ